MRNKPRNSDGTIRRTNQPRLLTKRSVIARWVEAETLHLKRLGMSFQVIADHIVGVARAKQQAMVPIPEQGPFYRGLQHICSGCSPSVSARHRRACQYR